MPENSAGILSRVQMGPQLPQSFNAQRCRSVARSQAGLLADGIACCISMVVGRAAPSRLRMIIRSIIEAARVLDDK
jgi:hypothetical protein